MYVLPPFLMPSVRVLFIRDRVHVLLGRRGWRGDGDGVGMSGIQHSATWLRGGWATSAYEDAAPPPASPCPPPSSPSSPFLPFLPLLPLLPSLPSVLFAPSSPSFLPNSPTNPPLIRPQSGLHPRSMSAEEAADAPRAAGGRVRERAAQLCAQGGRAGSERADARPRLSQDHAAVHRSAPQGADVCARAGEGERT